MVACNSVMLVVAAVLAVTSWRWGAPLPLLIAASLVIGTVNAFYLPSSADARQLMADARAAQGAGPAAVGQPASMSSTGGPVGGALVAFAGFAAASLTDSVSFGGVLIALIAIKPRFAPPAAPRQRPSCASPRTACGSHWRHPASARCSCSLPGVASSMPACHVAAPPADHAPASLDRGGGRGHRGRPGSGGDRGSAPGGPAVWRRSTRLAPQLGLTMIAAGELILGPVPTQVPAHEVRSCGDGTGDGYLRLQPRARPDGHFPRAVTWPVSRRC